MPNAILGHGGFHHAAIQTRDWAATMRFYRDALGCTDKITWAEAPKRAGMFDCGDGNYIEVFEDLAWTHAPIGPIYHLALRTTRIDAAMAHIKSMGYKVTVETRDVTIKSTNGLGDIPVRIAFIEGPNGESVELLQNSVL
ncbi:MAG: VOC family protein [Opitutaceae bacterium]|nr:VOC family protein [Opitutaceae bacterium]